jgi:response regulator RpfG family c-di-GMP phosphodiesterase
MNVLIVDDEEEIREILTFTLETEISADFIYAESGQEAIKKISEIDNLDLIICDYNMPNGNGETVYKYLLDNNITLPYVLCSSSKKEEFDVFNDEGPFLFEITKPYVYEGVSEMLKKYEQFRKSENINKAPVSKNETGYSTISLELLQLFPQIPSDIFVKISDMKMVKVINAGDHITAEEVEKYKKKKIKRLLIKKNEAKLYLDVLFKRIDDLLENEDSIDEDKVLDIHSVIMDTVRTLGLCPQIIRATEKSVEFAVNLFEKNKSFEDISKHIFGNKRNYLTKHSIALAYISTGILAKLPWDSPETRNKLVMASFLHDASIKEQDFNESEVDEDDPDTLLTFKSHPSETVSVLKQFDALPPDVDTIILEHHERPDGSGFPKQLSADQIKPLSSIFIFAHDIVDIIFHLEKDGKKPAKDIVIDSLDKDLYDTKNFKKSYEALSKIKLFKEDE